MTRKELNLAIFEGTNDRVLWQPRLEMWLYHHMEKGTLPERYRDKDYFGIYDALGASVRYAASKGLERYAEESDDVESNSEQRGNHHITTVRTPVGEIRTVHRDVWEDGELMNRRIVDFPVKTPQDLRVVTYLIERGRFRANQEAFREAADDLGHRAEPTMFLTSSGFTELIKNHCGLPGTYYLLHDHQADVEAYLEVCDRRDDRAIDAALELPCRIFNLGDHANNEFTPPPILKRYLIPRWQRISDKLHEHGRFVHTHWDGNSALMLPFLLETRLDGVESLTPAPMCDMTLEQMKEAVQDEMIVLDLIRAIDFLPGFPVGEILEFVRRAIDMFAPKLILGVSDELSEVGEIEKVEAISELVDKICGLAE